ncbi:MAG: hypothetical protein AAB268_03690, partial [Elusimicrobiota bacterium]
MSENTRPAARWLPLLAGVAVATGLLFVLRGVLTPVFLAFLIAYVFDPVVDRIERRGLGRSVAILALLAWPSAAGTTGA